MDRRWIDGVLWSCLLVMSLATLALLWGLAAGVAPWQWGAMAQGLVQP